MRALTLNELVHESRTWPRSGRGGACPGLARSGSPGVLCEAVCVPFRVEPPIFRAAGQFFTNNRLVRYSRARLNLGFAPKDPAQAGTGSHPAVIQTAGLGLASRNPAAPPPDAC